MNSHGRLDKIRQNLLHDIHGVKKGMVWIIAVILSSLNDKVQQPVHDIVGSNHIELSHHS